MKFHFLNNLGRLIVNYFHQFGFWVFCYNPIFNAYSARFMAETNYTEDNIRSLDWKEHIRMRPGMYIGKLGDGSSPDDGIYILLKEVIDNCIDEFVMGSGKTI